MNTGTMPTTLTAALADAESYCEEPWTETQRLAFKQGCWTFAMFLVRAQQKNNVEQLHAIIKEALDFEKDLGERAA